MKKILSMLLALVMIFALCACGADNGGELKAGLICLHDENSTYDLNFINAFTEACEANGVTPVIKSNVGETNAAYEATCELADSGCFVVFSDSFGHEDYVLQAASDYPEVEFCHATGTKAHTAKLDNFHNAFAAIYEGRYLDGVAAGLKLNEMIGDKEITEDEAILGYVGAHQYAEVISGYTAFYLGARSVCPTAKMKVDFTGSWYDEAAEKEMANNLIAQGCKVISGHADSMGIPTACESAGVPFVFYNGSVINACPNSFIVSTKINWEPYFDYAIKAALNDEPIDTDWSGNLATNSVLMTDVNLAVAAPDTVAKLNEVKMAIENGNINIFDTNSFTVNGETITSYMADIDYDENYEGDTEVIVDGCFSESTFRSAPYFDLTIDGIELLSK